MLRLSIVNDVSVDVMPCHTMTYDDIYRFFGTYPHSMQPKFQPAGIRSPQSQRLLSAHVGFIWSIFWAVCGLQQATRVVKHRMFSVVGVFLSRRIRCPKSTLSTEQYSWEQYYENILKICKELHEFAKIGIRVTLQYRMTVSIGDRHKMETLETSKIIKC